MLSKFRNKNGQIMPVLAVFMLTLVLVFVIVYNLGRMTYTRMETQNATDLAAVSTSAWQARGLNLLSTLNLTIAASYVGTIVAAAFGVYPDPQMSFPPFYIRVQLKLQDFIKNAFNKYHLGTGTAMLMGWSNRADFTFPYPLPPKLYVKQMKLSTDMLFNQTGKDTTGGREHDSRWINNREQRGQEGDNLNILHLKKPELHIEVPIASGRMKANNYNEPPPHNQCWRISGILRNRIRNALVNILPNPSYADSIMGMSQLPGNFCMSPSEAEKTVTIETIQHQLIFQASSSELSADDLPLPGYLKVFATVETYLKGKRRRQDYGHYYTYPCSTWVDSSWYHYTCWDWVNDSTVYFYTLSVEHFVGLDVKAAIELVFGMQRDTTSLYHDLGNNAHSEEVYVTSLKLPRRSTYHQILPPYITIAKSKVFNSSPDEANPGNIGLWKPTWRAVLMPVGQDSVEGLLSKYNNIGTSVDNAINQVEAMKSYMGVNFPAGYNTVKTKWDMIKTMKLVYH